jgi:hypothetical protein
MGNMDLNESVMETTRLIEQYLEGSLDESEKKIVEERALLDKNFSELIDLHREVNDSIRDNEFTEFATLAQQVGDRYFIEEDSSNRSTKLRAKYFTGKLFLKAAAFIVLLVTLGIVMKISFFNGISSEKLYRKYYTHYNADVIVRTQNNKGSQLESGLQAYYRHEYDKAITIFSSIAETDSGNYLAKFYRGLTYLETGEQNAAIKSFRDIPDTWDSPFIEHRNWYLALALLHNNNIPEAESLLRQINNNGGFYAGKAGEILKQLTS